ncbi:hypothetical protein [Paraburkholderia sp. BR14374]|uniref:hypothetical protein n=1 Tax=Paraburkholderia sp. BR14374 TaxID=3237007 RepID=UPI0034CE9D28
MRLLTSRSPKVGAERLLLARLQGAATAGSQSSFRTFRFAVVVTTPASRVAASLTFIWPPKDSGVSCTRKLWNFAARCTLAQVGRVAISEGASEAIAGAVSFWPAIVGVYRET